MPNILLLSEDDVFAADLSDQISHYAKDYNIIEKDSSLLPDIIVVDEKGELLKNCSEHDLKVPLFFLTSHAEEIGADCPATHIIIKPFSLSAFLDELHSCINIFENSENGYVVFNRYIVRPIKKDIFNQRNGEVVKLTEKEVAILKYLYKNRNRIVSKNELLQEVWGYAPDVTTHTIETHIYRLRQKVEQGDEESLLILTEEGGYKLKI